MRVWLFFLYSTPRGERRPCVVDGDTRNGETLYDDVEHGMASG